jgi:hypothetical protein
VSWNGRPEKGEQREGEVERSQARPASYTASCCGSLSKINPSSTASATPTTATTSAAADQKPVPAAAATAPAPPAAPTPPLPTAGCAHAPSDRGPKNDAHPTTSDPAAAQEHPHQPALQGDGGDPCSSALAASSEPAEACRGTPEIPRPSRISTAHTWTCSQQF